MRGWQILLHLLLPNLILYHNIKSLTSSIITLALLFITCLLLSRILFYQWSGQNLMNWMALDKVLIFSISIQQFVLYTIEIIYLCGCVGGRQVATYFQCINFKQSLWCNAILIYSYVASYIALYVAKSIVLTGLNITLN